MKRVYKLVLWSFLTIILTAVTQIGGIIFIISLIINRFWKIKFTLKPLVIFLGLYLTATFLVVPLVAPLFGRERVKQSDYIKPATFMTLLLNRNYVSPMLNTLLTKSGESLKGSGIKISYLDANFPFINGFPLLPHLSHNDGKKIDIALVYEESNGTLSDKQKSVSGYGVFEGPKSGETDQISNCLGSGFFQYDYPKYVSFGQINRTLRFSEYGTKKVLESILKDENLGKIFIEPHLKERLKLDHPKVRNHGCRSVRHDDHIHIQLK